MGQTGELSRLQERLKLSTERMVSLHHRLKQENEGLTEAVEMIQSRLIRLTQKYARMLSAGYPVQDAYLRANEYRAKADLILSMLTEVKRYIPAGLSEEEK